MSSTMFATRLLPALIICCVGAACATKGGSEPPAEAAPETATPEATAPTKASAQLAALGESGVAGTLQFTVVDGGVQIEGEVTGLPADSKHGFHIHEKGDCSSPDGKSAGGHFNPKGMDHGGLAAAVSHIGDLGNLVAGADGVAKISVVKHGATLGTGDGNILGRGVIVHADVDDEQTQPTGNAGGRVACGVIEAAQ